LIREALLHCPGVGPARLAQLRRDGVRSWDDVLAAPDRVPPRLRPGLVGESQRCLTALADRDIRYFVDRFAPADRWRIIAQFFEETTFFDIETTGLEWDASITVIACWHRGRLYHFVEHENLDAFLDLLDDVRLLASFNGAAFDVPRVLGAFHIPSLPCPHLDLRWMCYHRRLRGTLKDIADRMGIRRPADLRHADGALAVQLWHQWTSQNDRAARELLVRYCAADVLLLAMVAHRLSLEGTPPDAHLWACLPQAPSLGSRRATACGRTNR